MTEALIEARTRRSAAVPRCRLLMCGEYADRGSMPNRGPRLQGSRSHGVLVRFYRVGRRLHEKAMLCDNRLYLGSMNFSQASSANVERGAILDLMPAEAEAEMRAFEVVWGKGREN